MENTHCWYSNATCPECNVGPLAFAVRADGRTCYLLCVECGANYDKPPVSDDHNAAFDTPQSELGQPPRWASRDQIDANGWS